ncbi:hypothetical protein D917_03569 [Trichinella nativa]|uniref:Uncharacterized protein n=1 Tax=Trichinella nativa TaxID=6335 RepID=A0A1Y3E826_9BILA|nr:hypothetical protein D917_03569 [Trichinella nativa]
MTLNWYKPYGVVKAVFSLSRVSISTCQYPLARSSVENHCAPDNASNVSSIQGRGCILLCYVVQLSVVNAESTRPVLLIYKHYWGRPWTA